MDTATESERKYDTPRTFAMPEATGPVAAAGITRIGEPRTHELDAVYYDTEDLRLARARITLRRRTGGTDAGWHLKTPDPDADRIEHRLPLDDGDDVPTELLDRIRAVVRGRPLRPVARLRTRRREYPLQDESGRVLALLADDRVRAEAEGDSQRWREVEVELVDGDRTVLKALDKQLRAAGATPAAEPSKLTRALAGRLTGVDAVADPHDQPGRLPHAVGSVVTYVRAQREAIIGNDPAARQGDPTAVHAMRVATRRLRSTLRTFRGGLWERTRTDPLRDELSWLAEQLGGVRDRQVMATRLHAAVAELPSSLVVGPVDTRIDEHLDDDLRAGRRALGDALDDERYFTLLDDLDALLAVAPRADVRSGWVRRKVAATLRHADDLLDAAGNAPADAAPHGDRAEAEHHRNERFHDARKAYKQARYAIEVLASAEGRAARRLVKRLTALQDTLGDHQDAVITAAVLQEYAARADAAGDSAFTYGVLHAHQHAAGEAALDRVPTARRAAAGRKLRRWLR